MKKVRAKFIFNQKINEIKCEENEKMNEICKRYALESEKDLNKIYFLYNGGKLDKESTWIEIANPSDKHSKTMTILVDDINEEKNELTSKYIICPECGENVQIELKNYKISLDCKNGHKINDILFNKYEYFQKIASEKIVCNICNKTDMSKGNIYKCLACEKKNKKKTNICEECISKHEPKHKNEIINYEQNNYQCSEHKQKFIDYCKVCKKNICFDCNCNHSKNSSEIIHLKDMRVPKEEKEKKLKEDEKTINKFNNNINKLIKMLNKVKDYINKYYNIINKIIR